MKICVLGAGIIGVTSAYRLWEAGHHVTLVDAMPDAGTQASFSNGAQLSYSYVAPLADPSIWKKWPHYLFGSNSPMTLRFMVDPAQWTWLARFLQACTSAQVRRTTADLLKLAFYSRDQLTQLRAALPFDFQHRTAGKLVMYTDRRELNAARDQVAFDAQYGSEQTILGVNDCLDIEPALAASKQRWVGGVYTMGEEIGDCALFCKRLVEMMEKQQRFVFLRSTEVGEPIMRGGSIAGVKARDMVIEGDAFVLAMGAQSRQFARRAGISLPLYPLKGYSITVPLRDVRREVAPTVSITDISRKIVYARLGNRLRVAGRVELVGDDKRIPERAIKELKNGVIDMFPGCGDISDASALQPWSGFRPATPTGLPFIGPSPVRNLYLNTGHGSLGWTLACGSAALLTEQIAERATAIDATPYRFAS